VHALGHVLEKSFCKVLVRRKFLEVDWDQDLFGFFVDITNINTTLVGEENPIALRSDQ
jgi:hypothetical protein